MEFKNEFEKYLKTKILGRNLIYVDCTESTNLLAKKNHQEDDGTVFVAKIQKAGVGRKQRVWESKEGGLYMSILTKPETDAKSASDLTLVAGLAVSRAINGLTGEKAYIKWPNDIVVNNKKICGILSLMQTKNETVSYVVCGIGVNVNNNDFCEELNGIATSIGQITDKKISCPQVAAAILNEFEDLYLEFLKNGFKGMLDEYKKRCITLGKNVTITTANETYNAKAIDINSDGNLVVKYENEIRLITSADASVRGIMGYV